MDTSSTPAVVVPLLRRLPTRVVLATLLLTVMAVLWGRLVPESSSSVETIGDHTTRLIAVTFVASLILGFLMVVLVTRAPRFIANWIAFAGSWGILHVGGVPLHDAGAHVARQVLDALVVGVLFAGLYEIFASFRPR